MASHNSFHLHAATHSYNAVLSRRELATLLHALRRYQAGCGLEDRDHFDEAAGVFPLDSDEIDALCERLNLQSSVQLPPAPPAKRLSLVERIRALDPGLRVYFHGEAAVTLLLDTEVRHYSSGSDAACALYAAASDRTLPNSFNSLPSEHFSDRALAAARSMDAYEITDEILTNDPRPLAFGSAKEFFLDLRVMYFSSLPQTR